MGDSSGGVSIDSDKVATARFGVPGNASQRRAGGKGMPVIACNR